jgi:hypothetical protein
MTIGAVVFTLNGMRSLETCLKSIPWADPVMVLHSGAGNLPLPENVSVSSRVERAVSIEQAGQRFREMGRDWILHLWGEERLDETLQHEIVSLSRAKGASSSKAYRINVRSRILNRWVRGSLWGPSPALRLSADVQDLRRGWWEGTRGESRKGPPLLRGWIEDHSTEQLGHGLEQMNRFTTLCADRLARKGVRLGQVAMVLDSFSVGMRLLTMNGIVANGLAGVTFSILAGYTVLLGGAKRWEDGIQA